MEKTIDLNFGIQLKKVDTDYAKTTDLINNEARMDTRLGEKLK